jgi:hypothetical protein
MDPTNPKLKFFDYADRDIQGSFDVSISQSLSPT